MNTTDKGNLGAAIVVADLTKKGYHVFIPVGEGLVFDLVAYKDNRFHRLQVKYSSKGLLVNSRVSFKNHKAISRSYENDDFDYYALYLPAIEKVVYPSIKFKGCKITTSVPNCPASFHWYEDFLEFTDCAEKRNRTSFGYTYESREYSPRFNGRKVERPSKEELKTLLWEKPATEIAKIYNVSDKAVTKWANSYGLDKPIRGYWTGKK